MSVARANLVVEGAQISDAELLWYDRTRWASFVDGLHHVERTSGEPPAAGSAIQWQSHPRGRGTVVERAIAYEPGDGQTLEVEDERLTGVQTVSFSAVDGGVRIALELDYRLAQRGPLGVLTDLLFVRRAQADSLRRTLLRFSHELRDELTLRD